jgi:hypothetical protein
MTNKIGQPITTLRRDSVCGTSTLCTQLSGPDPDHPAVGAKSFLLTNRQVVCDDGDKMDITDITHPSLSAHASTVPPAEHIYVIQPGPDHTKGL